MKVFFASLFLSAIFAVISNIASAIVPGIAFREPIIAGVNIPPPPQNKASEFFFNSSNAVSFSDAYFDYTGFAADKLEELFDDHGKFGFVSARIQLNAKTALKRWYLDDDEDDEKLAAVIRLLRTTLLKPDALFNSRSAIPLYLVDKKNGRRYVTPLQTVEYVLSYTNFTSSSSQVVTGSQRPRRAIFNFCGTCTGCTDSRIPPPNYDSHGTGTVDDCDVYVAAWRNIGEYFSDARFANDELHFELFNEPHAGDIRDVKFRGCLLQAAKAVDEAVESSRHPIEVAAQFSSVKIPRVIWPASGWEANATDVYKFSHTTEGAALRNFDIGWHFYPFWCSNGSAAGVSSGSSIRGSGCSVKQFEQAITDSLSARDDISAKVWLTEYGGSLYDAVDYFNPTESGVWEQASATSSSTDARFFRALADVAGVKYAGGCAQLRGLFLWHAGYFFDDSYTVNGNHARALKDGVAFVRSLGAGLNFGDCRDCTDYWSGSSCPSDQCKKCHLAVAPVSETASDVSVDVAKINSGEAFLV